MNLRRWFCMKGGKSTAEPSSDNNLSPPLIQIKKLFLLTYDNINPPIFTASLSNPQLPKSCSEKEQLFDLLPTPLIVLFLRPQLKSMGIVLAVQDAVADAIKNLYGTAVEELQVTETKPEFEGDY